MTSRPPPLNDRIAYLRAYCRGYLSGESAAVVDGTTAYRREALVLVAFRALGARPAEARAIIDQARQDAHMAIPDLSEFGGRLLGAEMILSLLRSRLEAELNRKAA